MSGDGTETVPLPEAVFCPAGYAVPIAQVEQYGRDRHDAALAQVVAWLRGLETADTAWFTPAQLASKIERQERRA